MRKRRIKTILSVIAIATMMLSSMGIGVFAEVEQTAPAVQAQAEGDQVEVGNSGEGETPQEVEKPAAKAGDRDSDPVIEPSSGTIKVGETLNLTANFGEGVTVTWKSSEETIATVSDTGVVTGVAAGKATITATEVIIDSADDTVTPREANCEITVEHTDVTYSFASGATIVQTLSGHQRIKVVWSPAYVNKTQDGTTTKVEANRYIVMRAPAGGSLAPYATINVTNGMPSIDGNSPAVQGSGARSPYGPWTKLAANVGKDGSYIYFEDRDVGDGLMDNATRQFRGGDWTYQIVSSHESVTGPGSNTATDNCVRTSAVALKIKVKKNLKSHDKQHKGLSLKKGSTVYTCAFGYGRYQFIHNGNFYWLNRVGTKSHKTVYDKNHPYSDEEVLYYINGRDGSDGLGLTSSSTGKLIWVNTYTQRIYVFQGSAGNYSLVAGNGAAWKVSTGKPATPTIRYIDPKDNVLDTGRIVGKNKAIDKKVKKRHGIPSWNCFSTWNAIHGQKKSWSIKGVPKSNGCVRNTNAHAKYIYNTCPKKTRVLIF